MSFTSQQEANKDKDRRFTQAAISLGYQLLAAMLVLAGGGYYMDQRRGGGSVFTLSGIALAFLYGWYEVWKLVRFMAKDAESTPSKPEEKRGP